MAAAIVVSLYLQATCLSIRHQRLKILKKSQLRPVFYHRYGALYTFVIVLLGGHFSSDVFQQHA